MTDKIGIASIFRNEYPFIVEWLAYHRSLGVRRFFIADNESDDGTRELLQILHDLGYINLVLQPIIDGENSQLAAYQRILEVYGAEIEWLAFIDADEFVGIEKNDLSLVEYLRRISKIRNVGAIAINWAVYGSSHWMTAGREFVTDRFTMRAEQNRSINRHYKTFIRTSACRGVGTNPHAFKLKKDLIYVDSSGRKLGDGEWGGLTKDVAWAGIRINHYVVKSRSEFFTKKRPRGRPGGKTRAAEFFEQHDINEVEDRLGKLRASALLREYDEIVASLKIAGVEYGVEDKRNDPLHFTGGGGMKFRVDSVFFEGGRIECKGWVDGPKNNCIDFKMLVNYACVVKAISIERMVRADVARHLKGDPGVRYGFKCVFDAKKLVEKREAIEQLELCIGGGESSVDVLVRLKI